MTHNMIILKEKVNLKQQIPKQAMWITCLKKNLKNNYKNGQ